MSNTIYNLTDELRRGAEAIDEAHRNAISEVEDKLGELDEFLELFDDVHDARDASNYCDEMRDIFDDAYDAQQVKELSDQLSYEGIDDFADFESFAETLRDEITDELNADRAEEIKELDELRGKYEAAKELIVKLEDERAAALLALRGKTCEQAEIDQRAAEEQAYECGLNDGIIIRKQSDENTAPDLDVTLLLTDQSSDEA